VEKRTRDKLAVLGVKFPPVLLGMIQASAVPVYVRLGLGSGLCRAGVRGWGGDEERRGWEEGGMGVCIMFLLYG
jgi:hypothetical protein